MTCLSPGSPPRCRSRSSRAFSLLELLTTVAIIAIVAALILPALQGAQAKALRTRCGNNLRQIGIAFQSWAHDHDDRYPMEVSTNSRGTLEFARTGESMVAYKHFQALSNELVETKVLVCPVDHRAVAANFAELQNSNVSYLVNAKPVFGHTDSVLAADRNVRTSGRMEYTYLQFGPGDLTEWSTGLHGARGNVLYADTHIEAVAANTLQKALTSAGDVVLVLPQPDVDTSTSRGTTPGSSSAIGSGSSPIADAPNAGSSSAIASPVTNATPGATAALGGNPDKPAPGNDGVKSPQPASPSPSSPRQQESFGRAGNGRSALANDALASLEPTQAVEVTSAPAAKHPPGNNAADVEAKAQDEEREDIYLTFAKWLGLKSAQSLYGLLLLLLLALIALRVSLPRKKKIRRRTAVL